MLQIQATQVRPGMVIKFEGELYSVFSMTHRTPGNLRAFVQVRIRNLRNGSMKDHRFASTDRVEKADLEQREMEFLYAEQDGPPIWITVWPTTDSAGTMVQLAGAVLMKDSLKAAAEPTPSPKSRS